MSTGALLECVFQGSDIWKRTHIIYSNKFSHDTETWITSSAAVVPGQRSCPGELLQKGDVRSLLNLIALVLAEEMPSKLRRHLHLRRLPFQLDYTSLGRSPSMCPGYGTTWSDRRRSPRTT